MSRITIEDAEGIANMWDDPGKKPKKRVRKKDWMPDLNPTQKLIWDDTSPFLLTYGEKGSGKGYSLLHKLVRHCYENTNAFQILIAPSIFTGKEGIWHDLHQDILPHWKHGIGLEYTDSKLDPETKDRHCWIANMRGGWSKMVLKSIPHPAFVEARVKGPAPSGVYIDEITNCNGREYFTYPAAQLMRRRDIEGPMQFTASCNPEGPSNWVYKVWFEEVVDSETGKRDPDYAVYHVPITENLHRLPAGYVEHLRKVLRDPIQKRRLIDGEWIDAPTGQSIFRNQFIPAIHVRGDVIKGTGLRPIKGVPISVGYDPGPANFCVAFMQMLVIEGKVLWIIFDELNFVGKHRTYKRVVTEVLKTMDHWQDIVGCKFQFEHICDAAAFTNRRSDGSFEVMDIEREGKGRIRMKACPKGAGSIVDRVRMLQSFMDDEAIYISAKCQRTIDMCNLLSSKNLKPGEYSPENEFTPVRNIYSHPFDAATYAMFYNQTRNRRYTRADAIKPMVYSAGSRT